ncbi:penicillin-binding protein, partial [Fischerella thermalis CCMEE 5273]
MGKFTSWFKERTTKLSDSQTAKSGSAVGDTQAQEESTSEQNHDDNRPPTKLEQAKQIFTQVVAKFPGSHKPLYRRYWFWAGLGVSGGVATVCYGVWSIDQTLPNKTELTAVVREQTLTIKAADGTILQQQGEATREQLKLEEIPDKFKK